MPSLFDKIIKLIKHPNKIIIILGRSRISNFIPDKLFLKIQFRARIGKKLDLKNPVSFNEKLQWMKLYDRNPLYTNLVDKYRAREYVKERIGEEYLIPLIGQWKNPEDIDFSSLPEKFVLKCNHNSGTGMFICKNKEKADLDKIRYGLKKGLKENYYIIHREWPYKNVERRIICEQYIEDSKTGELRDYKFLCFNGVPKLMYIASERQTSADGEPKFDFFDIDGKHLDFFNAHPNAAVTPEIPSQFEKMKELASKLSDGLRHVRVDFYEADGVIYFGEMTFFHMSGFYPFEPYEWDIKIGEWLTLK